LKEETKVEVKTLKHLVQLKFDIKP